MCPHEECIGEWSYDNVEQSPCSNPDDSTHGPWCPTQLDSSKNYVKWTWDFQWCHICASVTLITRSHQCASPDENLGNALTVDGCTDMCRRRAGCRFFIYGKGTNATSCRWEKTKSEACEEGFVPSHDDFYRVNAAPITTTTTTTTTTTATATTLVITTMEDATKYRASCNQFLTKLFEQVTPSSTMMEKVAHDTNILPMQLPVNATQLRAFMDRLVSTSAGDVAFDFKELKEFYIKQSDEMVYRNTICKFIHEKQEDALNFIDAHLEKLKYFIHRVYLLEAYTIAFLSDREVARQLFAADRARPDRDLDIATESLHMAKSFFMEKGMEQYFDSVEGTRTSNKYLRINIDIAAFLGDTPLRFPSAAKTGLRLVEDPFLDVFAIQTKMVSVRSSLTGDELLQTLGCDENSRPCDDSFVISKRFQTHSEHWKQWVQMYNVWDTSIVIEVVQHWEHLLPKLFLPCVMAPNDFDDYLGYRVVSLWKGIADYASTYVHGSDPFKAAWTGDEPELYQYLLETADTIGLPPLEPALERLIDSVDGDTESPLFWGLIGAQRGVDWILDPRI
eukprot:GEMP01001811.1.p1 GENE.GEMP01001811.1~~GEMP01001811.1.p1  ORF type:complete len:631 (+),score=75.90 GEMP01001811.1:206-1894(+)